jgi:hypothetical protein
MGRAIGGFLPLRVACGASPAMSVLDRWTANNPDVWLLHNARSALHSLWTGLKPHRVWLPAYTCSEIARAVPAGVAVQYYPLSKQLLPNVDFLDGQISDGDHVLAIDYFGRPPATEFTSLVHDRTAIGWIQDGAHALGAADTAWGDWILYSPRKLLGAPDGGILVARQKPLWPIVTVPASNFAFALPSIERLEDRDEIENERWYANYVREEAAMKISAQTISLLTMEVLRVSDFHQDCEARRRNYQTLHRRLGQWAFFPDPEISFAPLGFPMRVEAAGAICANLAKQRIFAARHWTGLPSDPNMFVSEHRLATELLTLPCDYRYDELDMNRVADAFLKVISVGL